ncbi:hypothetical protein [Nocardia farcinica]|uniref:hypothetical protein n=1 Tax=Nocardia farcinica TaxID=37329 RepID=UPI001895F747|nr:hypothetical protein [Nocardia farcinica]MBF6189507.1 hypothetical protein [Nocardia farcinica]
MSTRSIVGIISKDLGPVGVYVHSAGCPEARMLLEHTKTGGGWSYLAAEGDLHNTLGADRAEVVPGYGLAYRDGDRTTLERLEDFKSGHIPYAYFIDPDTGDIHCYDQYEDCKLTVYPASEGKP